MPRYGYLVVEGPHDVEFAVRLFAAWRFRRVRLKADLDSFWHPLVPVAFPHGGDLQKLVPVPLFIENGTHSIGILSAMGDSRIVASVEESLSALPQGTVASIGIILDSDDRSPIQRFQSIADGLRTLGLPQPRAPRAVAPGPPATGVFVLPDNTVPGTLEDLLIECAKIAYPKLLLSAFSLVDSIRDDPGALEANERADFDAPAGRRKVVVATIANILKPGKAIQVSIQDNRWLDEQGLSLPRVATVIAFLQRLMDLP